LEEYLLQKNSKTSLPNKSTRITYMHARDARNLQ
jgi:hypothetical protein